MCYTFYEGGIAMAKKWIKLWVAESLRGTIRFDFTPAERGIWYDLLALAGDCRQDGFISPNGKQAYPLKWVANILNIEPELLEITLKKCEESQRIERKKGGIKIVNWHRYQSEYERQKPYRERKKGEDEIEISDEEVEKGIKARRKKVDGLIGQGEDDPTTHC
jgi:hypothetical protein